MKLLTLNCHSWQEDNQLDKIKYLVKTIVKNNYDVIALQEVSQSIDSKIVFDNIKEDNYALVLINEIKNLGGFNYNFSWDFSHIGYGKYEEGLAILSKHEIINKESFYSSKSKDINFWKTRKIVKGTIKYNNENIDIYSCHLGWWNDKEEDFIYQGKNLYKKICESNNLAFVMGDFNNNALVRNEGYDFIKDMGLYDTYNLAAKKGSGYTVTEKIDGWEENTEKMRLDIIFTNKLLDVSRSSVIFNGVNEAIVSDHYGVEIIVEH